MRDKHRLERIVDVTRRVRDVERAELAAAQLKRDQAEQALQSALEAERSAVQTLLGQPERTVAELAVLAAAARAETQNVHAARGVLAKDEDAVERQREETVAATRQLRVVETLRDRADEREAGARAAREQSELDEHAARPVTTGGGGR